MTTPSVHAHQAAFDAWRLGLSLIFRRLGLRTLASVLAPMVLLLSAMQVSAQFVFTVTSTASGGGSISPSGARAVFSGNRLTYTLTPDANHALITVGGCLGDMISSTQYQTGPITSNCTVTAVFLINSYSVTPVAGSGGAISPATPRVVNHGGQTTFTLIPNPSFSIGTVTGCGGTRSGNSYTTGPITSACTVNASFVPPVVGVPFTVSTAIGGVVTGGSISPTSRSVLPGATTTFTVTPNSGLRVGSVTGCGVAFNDTGSPQTEPLVVSTLAINAPCTVVANFVALPTFVVTATAGAGGRVTPTTVSVPQGLITNITVTPDGGFRLTNVTGCGIVFIGSPSVTNPTTWPTAPITAACTVSATFASVPVTPPVVTTTPMVEFLHPALNYYFLTSRGNEIALLDRTPPFVRTGQSFLVYPNAVAGTQPITRFYFDRVAVSETRGSHFYTLVDAELNALVGLNPGNVAAPRLPFSEGIDSFAFLPVVEGVGGSCAPSLVPVLRVFRGNARFPDDPNHRFTTSTAIYNDFVAQGWDGEGVKFCVPG